MVRCVRKAKDSSSLDCRFIGVRVEDDLVAKDYHTVDAEGEAQPSFSHRRWTILRGKVMQERGRDVSSWDLVEQRTAAQRPDT